ncbi:MAG: hypothetical protein KatS3mg105_3006 [Gemmatales bacterium]|nr:MAG: hypothetical protein KatS3mg105_3006 [Gemmatales bacterium]
MLLISVICKGRFCTAHPDVGRPKLQSAKERLQAINPDIQIDTYETRLTSENAMAICEPYDIIIDGTDNFPTRYLVNDVCVLQKKPNVYGSIFRFDGQASVFFPPHGPCYRCLYPEPPPPGEVPSCAEGGVLGILPGLIGCIQATEAIKLILNKGSSLIGRLLLYDALEMTFQEFRVRRNPKCPICGDQPTITQLIDYEQFCGIRGEEADAPAESDGLEITVEELKRRLDRGDDLLIVDVRNPEEYDICRLANSKLIPLPQLPDRMHELDSAREMVIHCRSGMRSLKATRFPPAGGFSESQKPQRRHPRVGPAGSIRVCRPINTSLIGNRRDGQKNRLDVPPQRLNVMPKSSRVS